MSTRKLLLADDSVTIQKVVNLTFADEGIEVFTVGDGDSAVAKLAEISPDLVLADVNMPGLNGYEVCERIKNNPDFQHIPVVLLVGSFEPFDEEEARRVGANDFLTKPFQSIRQLVSKVTMLLDAIDGDESPSRDSIAASSFADTLDMDKPEIAESKENTFDDGGMDDELIQANPVSNFALDESAKFETREISEPIEDAGKTQPLSVYDLKDFDFVAADSSSETENQSALEEREETDSAPQSSESEIAREDSPVAPESKSSSYQDSDDEDFLEIPFDEDEDEWEEENQPEESRQSLTPIQQDETAEFVPSEPQTEEVEPKEFETASDEYQGANEIVVGSLTEPSPEELKVNGATEDRMPESASEFSPEMIEAIADRVIAKLSDKIIREIAWEVVPQHADLIIRKMVEEKLREQ